jgi:SAM-dependent methyltransferase
MPDLPFSDHSFSAIWACASLLHLPRGGMLLALRDCRRAVKTGGHLWFSVKEGDGEGDDEGRFCTLWKTAELRPLVTEAGFDILQATERPSVDGRSVIWATVLARAH